MNKTLTKNHHSFSYKVIRLTALILSVLMLSSCGVVYRVNSNGEGLDTEKESYGNNSAESESSDTENETEKETGSVVLPKDKRLRFIAVGDNMNHSAIFNEAAALASSMGESGYYYDSMYENIAARIENADIAFVNHESPIAGDGFKVQGYPSFNGPKESGDILVDLGFNVINIANNHMLDVDNQGTGYLNSIKYWKTKNVLMIGGYESENDYNQLRIFEKDGIKIAFLSYTYGINPNKAQNDASSCVVPLIDKETIKNQINAAKGKTDLIFVSLHWGKENENTANSSQKDIAKYIADLGADVIIGHHSHTIQPIEWIDGVNGNKTLCIYSLGNFICTMLNWYNVLGGACSFDIVKEGNDVRIENVVLEPFVIHYLNDTSKYDELDLYVRHSIKLYWLKDYSENLARSHGAQYYKSFSLQTLYDRVYSTIDEAFLPEWMKENYEISEGIIFDE